MAWSRFRRSSAVRRLAKLELLDPPDVVELSSGRSAEHSSAESLEVSSSQSTTAVPSSGVTDAESADSGLVPMALVAVTVNV